MPLLIQDHNVKNFPPVYSGKTDGRSMKAGVTTMEVVDRVMTGKPSEDTRGAMHGETVSQAGAARNNSETTITSKCKIVSILCLMHEGLVCPSTGEQDSKSRRSLKTCGFVWKTLTALNGGVVPKRETYGEEGHLSREAVDQRQGDWYDEESPFLAGQS